MTSMFNASEVVTDLRFDFSKYRPDPAAEGLSDEERDRRKLLADEQWTGTIPEPSDDDIERLFNQSLPEVRLITQRALAGVLERQRAGRLEWWQQQPREAGAVPPAGDDVFNLEVPAEMLAAEQEEYLASSHEARLQGRERTFEALAEFCHGTPSRAVLEALPWRVFQHFTGWLSGQFRPETFAAAMNA